MQVREVIVATGSLLDTGGAEAPASSHIVQFYDSDPFLIGEVARFAGTALSLGGSFVLVATPAHRELLAAELEARGFDVARMAGQGRYVALNAAATLESVLVDGQPDPARFTVVLGDVLDRAAAASFDERAQVAVFGEMVALLAVEGAHQAAVQLEHLWNELGRSWPISLLCAYPMTAFACTEHGAALAEICAAHQQAAPAESYTALDNEAARSQAVLQLQQRALALASEVAARRETAALLRQRDMALADLLERVPVALQQLDEDGTIRWANRAALDLAGAPPGQHVGHNIADWHVEADVIAGILGSLARGEPVQDQPATLRRHDGSTRQVRISSFVGHEPDVTCLITLDVTDELVATETTARLAAIVDSSSDAIVGKTLNGIVTSWNQGAERLFGYSAEEMVGGSIARIVPPERQDELAEILARLSRGQRIANHETERVRSDGSRVEISVSISPIHDRAGKITGVAKIARDITERRRHERRRQELLEVVAHDLRTPLTTVLGYAQLLQRRLGDDVALSAIASQAARIERLLADVLEMERLESGRQYLRRAPVDLAELARESARQAALLAGVDGIRVEAPEQPIVGEWDADRVAQILANLLDNAGKHAPGAEVVVEVGVSGDEARVAVRDNGPGIAAIHLPYLFDRFVRVSAGSGLGLGLYISRALADAHGGRLWVESTPGAGSVFTLALPLIQRRPRGEHRG